MHPAVHHLLLAATFLTCACGSNASDAPADEPDGAVVLDAAPDGSGWRSISAVGGGPIQEIGVAALDGKLYLLGGFDDQLAIGNRLQVYEPDSDTWTAAASLPIAVHHPNLVAHEGKLYMLGAMQLDGFSFLSIGNCFVYDPTEDAWTALGDMPAGTERGSSIVGSVGDRIIVAGGYKGVALSDVLAYDPALDQWDDTLPALPNPTDHAMGAAIDGALYIAGGRNGAINSIREDLLVLRGDLSQWEELEPMPTARGGGAAGVVEGRLIVVGGEGNQALASGVFSEVESYDPATDRWDTLDPMQVPRHGMAAVGIGDTLYVPGGATKQGFGAVADSEALRP